MVTSSGSTTSLPLMGIRISSRICPAPARRPAPHYPSWGSGSVAHRFGGFLHRVLSLPLMGIRIFGWQLLAGPGVVLLTTPHGDQDPGGGGEALADLAALSLPLMGIRIQRGSACTSRRPIPLTTPHGDQDQVGAVPERVRTHGLTTPHGDQDLGVLAGLLMATSISLPLMGIRILGGDDRGVAAAVDSLPLMGIRICAMAARVKERAPGLTTPHGDQDRGRSGSPPLLLRRTSLPLMGIRIR